MPRLFYVYVIELKCEVLNEPKFAARNPDHRADKPCVYVGSSYLTPEERFEQHIAGHKANYYAHNYWVRLRPRNYEHFNPMATRDEAEAREVALAESLRRKGYAVWQA